MAKEKMMPYMTGFSNGYTPPKGSAGSSAFGEYSHRSNPLPVPMKGSQAGNGSTYMSNPDREKVMRLKDEQARNENLRGKGC